MTITAQDSLKAYDEGILSNNNLGILGDNSRESNVFSVISTLYEGQMIEIYDGYQPFDYVEWQHHGVIKITEDIEEVATTARMTDRESDLLWQFANSYSLTFRNNRRVECHSYKK